MIRRNPLQIDRIIRDFKYDRTQGGDFFNTLHRKMIASTYFKYYELWSLKKFYRKGLILNIGAGRDKLGDNVVSIDITDTEDNYLGEIPNPDIIADMHQLPFAGSTFDCVVATHVLEHSRVPLLALEEWLRVVKDNGIVCGILPNFYYGSPLWYYHRNPTHYQRFTDADFYGWLSQNGFFSFCNLIQYRRMKKMFNPLSFDWALMKKGKFK